MAFCTPAQVIQYIYGAKLDKQRSLELSSSSISMRIEEVTAEIEAALELTGRPIPPSEPLNNPYLILELINVEIVAAEIIRTRAVAVDRRFARQADVQREIARRRLKRLAEDDYIDLWDKSLPLEPLAAMEYCLLDLPDYKPDKYPWLPDFITRSILRHGAEIRAFASIQGYPQDLSKLTTAQRLIYQRLVGKPVRAYLLRAIVEQRASESDAVGDTVNQLLKEAEDELQLFNQGEFDHIFNP